MIIVLFHVLYLFGKFVYQNYRTSKKKSINDEAVNTEEQFEISERIYRNIDPEATQDFTEHSIRFFPPAYVQRYVAVSDVLNNSKYQGKLRKVAEFGCAELDFLIYLKNAVGVEEILCVDIDRSVLDSYKDKGAPLVSEYLHTRTTPLVIEICEGSVTHNDKKLEKTDAVICIELIEHLYPDTLTDLPYNIFGFIKPKLVVITTPNADFNVLFPNFSGFRHPDHKFEWTRQQFQDWAENITLRYPDYIVTFDGICKGPEGTEHLGSCTQMAIFHRVSDKDTYSIGIEGLFKTVAKHEYPFRVDNRSDEQKILDEAAYYIRHLSFQDSDMEEEVPLKKLLDMLRSFHISVDVLRSILEEAGWTIESRDFGPVVLVPPPSTFSDFSTVEDPFWTNEYSDTDADDWNREPGPPINSSRFLEEDSSNIWDNQNWDEEPSIVIPQNNFVHEDNTYLFDEENVLLDNVSQTTRGTETFENHTEISSEEHLHPIPSVDELEDSLRDNVLSRTNESVELSDSFNRKLEGIEVFDTTADTQDDALSMVAQKLNRTLDFPVFLSVSRASTSPEPYLLQSVQMDQHLRDDSICNQSMSNDWTLNNSLELENLSINRSTETGASKLKTSSLKNDFDDSNRLHSIYLNTSYKETEDSDIEQLSSDASTSTDCHDRDQIKSVQQNTNVSQLSYESQSNSSISLVSNVVLENQPQFTSSPKIETKVNNPIKKRRSLDYKEQRNSNHSPNITQKSRLVAFSSNTLLETSNDLPLRSNNDVNISTPSTVNLSPDKQWYNKGVCPIYQGDIEVKIGEEIMDNCSEGTLTSSDTSTAASTLNDHKHGAEASLKTSSLGTDDGTKRDQTLQVNLTTLGRNILPNSCLTEKSTEEQTHLAATNSTRIESKNSEAKIQMANQNIIKSETCGDLVPEIYDGKTELGSEMHSSRDSRNVSNVNSIEPTCNHAKDISSLESTLFVSNLDGEDTKDVRNASVLKSERRLDCNTENREYKCINVSSHAVEAAESTELKPSSPENVETPPNSWSPEVMDSGYPNSASAQDMTPEYDLSSIAQDHPSDSESPSIAEPPRLEVLEVIEVENGDLANNNRDGEGNNMLAAELNDLEDLQPLIDVLENDLENENDIYVLGNGFPIWLLRILDMANPVDVEIHVRDERDMRFPNEGAGDEARNVNLDRDEGFDGSSEENSDIENEMRENVNDANENALLIDIDNDNENALHSDSGSEQWAPGGT